MNATPVMDVFDRYCMFCHEHRKRLHCLTKYKAQNENYVESIEKFLNLTLDLPINVISCMHVCEKCINTCKMYSKFKTDSVKNLSIFIERNRDRFKRMTSSNANKQSVCSSVQKISLETTTDKERERNQCKSNKSLSFQEPVDHTYSVSSHESGKTYGTGSVDHCGTGAPGISRFLQDKAVRNIVEQICNALREMPKRSGLVQKRPGILTETNWFLKVFEEMKQNRPQLLKMLLISLGNIASCFSYFKSKNCS